MRKHKLHPELEKVIGKLPYLPFGRRWTLPLADRLMNFYARGKVIDGVSRTEALHDGVKLFIYSPDEKRTGAALLWIHGGGHVAGRPENLNAVASRFAKALGAVVIAPKYRLSPKHPFPADLDDCLKGWDYGVSAAADLGIDAERIAIVGNSAGGGLAAALAQRIFDAGGTQPAAQILFYPMLDDRTVLRNDIGDMDHYIWTQRFNRIAWSAYLAPHEPGAETLPDYAAPARRASLKGLPPAWIGTGDIDLFFDEIETYVDQFKQDGVDHDYVIVPGGAHAFEGLVPSAAVSQQFLESAQDFLRKHLAID